jgi:TP901 family phage tail tape measure protein
MPAGKELFKLFGLIGMQGVERTQKQLKAIDKQVRKSQKEIDRLGRRASRVGKTLTKAFTVPLLIVGAAVTKIGADFDAAFTKSIAIMGDLSDTMQKDLRNAAIEVSKVVDFSAKEAAEAYFFLASAGKTAAQSIGLLPLVAKFAQAGAFGLARATDLLTDAQSALGLSSKDTVEDMENMTRVSDVLVKANTLANATVAQFSESLTNKAGAALRILGKDIEEGTAVLAVFADQGLKGAAAGESLNIVLRDLQRSALKSQEAFKRAKVSVFDQNGEMRNMADIVTDLDSLLLGMSDKQKRATLTTLGFQDKSISSTMALLGNAEAIREYETELRSAAGITDEVAKKQLDTFWKKLGLLKNRLIAVALQGKGFAEIGNEVLLPMLEKVVSAVERLNKWWNSLDDTTRRTAKGFIVLVAAIGPVVFIVGKLITFSKVLIPLLVAIRGGITGMSIAMANLQKSMLFWTVLIGAIVALGWFWFSQWDTMSVQLEALMAKITLFLSRGANAIVQAFASAFIKVIDVLSKVSGFIPGLTEKLRKAKVGILRFQAGMFRALGEQQRYTTAINSQTEATAKFSDTLKEAIKDGKEALGIKDKTIKKTKEQLATELAATKAAEANAKKRKQFDQDILDQMEKIGLDKFELLKLERIEALREANKLGADISAVKKFYAAKEEELLAEDEKTRQKFNQRTKAQIEQLSLDKLELLELEKQAALLKANELGAEKEAIINLYALREQELKDKLREEEAAKDEGDLKRRFRQATTLGNKLNSALARFSDNRLKRVDLEEKRKIEAIQNSFMTEEQKEAAIKKVEEETEKRRQELERQRARREKLAALFNIGINTASAVVEALPNIPLSIAVGLLGVAEGVAVATAPLPFFEGALVKGSDQGVPALVGERDQDELVFPLEKGIGLFIDGLMERLSEIELPTFGAPVVAEAAGLTSTVHLHIGTLIADDRGLKELERRLDTVRIAENQRKGF